LITAPALSTSKIRQKKDFLRWLSVIRFYPTITTALIPLPHPSKVSAIFEKVGWKQQGPLG
jgi:hypothetical protein